MTCLATVTVTPLAPQQSSYDPGNPDAPGVVAGLVTWGGYTNTHFASLGEQCKADEVILGPNVAARDDHTLDPIFSKEYFKVATAFVHLAFFNRQPDMQLLTLFKFRKRFHFTPSAEVQFFVGQDSIRDR